MHTVIYDGSFDGFLTGIFEIYEYGLKEVVIMKETEWQTNIFGNEHLVITDKRKVERVWKGLQQRLSGKGLGQIYKAFLSEFIQIENTLLAYIQHAFRSSGSVEYDFSHPAVLTVSQTATKVAKEKHRMEAFVRFQLTKDNLYYATVQPDYNVLPLICDHFEKRYADQQWLIYDVQRRYGIYYDLKTTEVVEINFHDQTSHGKNVQAIIAEEEMLYQVLWQQYFESVNIAARKNLKLHIQHMPRRYWRFLTEKKSKIIK